MKELYSSFQKLYLQYSVSFADAAIYRSDAVWIHLGERPLC